MFVRLKKKIEAICSNKSARQAAQMALLRFGGLGIGAIAQIYAARQLGPEKLGISGMALAAIAQGGLLVSFGADIHLVREYRNATTDEQRSKLVRVAFTLRVLLTVLLALAGVATLPWLRGHPEFLLAAACVIPMIFFQMNQALWVLQAREAVPAQYLANTASAVFGAVLVFCLIRPESPAGIDLVIAVPTTVLAFGISWFCANKSLPRLEFDFRAMSRLLRACIFLFLSAIVTYGYTRFEQPLVGTLRSVEELGLYRSAWQIINGIAPFLSMVALLLYPKLITWRAESLECLWLNQKRLFWKFLPAVTLIVILAIFLIPLLYPFIFGQVFAAAALPCALLFASKMLVILNGIFGWGLWAANKDKTMLAIMAAVGISSVMLNLLLIPRFGMLGAASVNLFSETLILIACFYFMRRLVASSHA